jgi:hypothetical protein
MTYKGNSAVFSGTVISGTVMPSVALCMTVVRQSTSNARIATMSVHPRNRSTVYGCQALLMPGVWKD